MKHQGEDQGGPHAPSEASSDSNEQKGAAPQASARRSEFHIATVLRGILKLVVPLLVITAVSFATWKIVATKPDVNRRPPREKTYAVEVKLAEPGALQPDIGLFGTVSAARTVDLRALVSGQVVWVNPSLLEGHLIEQNDPLVRIDPFEYQGSLREAKANLSEARAQLLASKVNLDSDEATLKRLEEQLEIATNDLDRAETLLQKGSLTRQTFESRKLIVSQRQQTAESTRFNLQVLKAQIKQQEANIDRLEWRVEQAQHNLDNTALNAPFTGLVQSKSVAVGRNVSASDTLVSLYDPQQMDVRFTLSDAQYGRLISDDANLIGRKVRVNWQLGDLVRSNAATITRVTPEVNAANGGVEVYARIMANSELRTGTFVEIIVPDKVYDNAISIPQAAIYNGDRVYINEKGRMAPRQIKVLAYLGDTALIDGAGIAPGAEIVTTRIAEAGPGLKLVIPGADGGPTEPQDRESSAASEKMSGGRPADRKRQGAAQ
ncbi:efflux RND transporter periplasmic adaptor subunit [uncultured Cohaesibacter sp.]|uniref:efflux RND transporter periplasmic adaptor subunit n=1 Tax=uncultured Cohaesibacter sp. TaxID=1002546 RepID=UPI00293027C7|nr:efflux RND transporter periplasmic adaptor subunit [uncultured Cohaesibacter sp.]